MSQSAGTTRWIPSMVFNKSKKKLLGAYYGSWGVVFLFGGPYTTVGRLVPLGSLTPWASRWGKALGFRRWERSGG